MAPTYKDLGKTWLSNWPAGVRGAHLCACVHARRNRGRVQVWKGAQTVSRSLHTPMCVTHYTGPIPSRSSHLLTGENSDDTRNSPPIRASPSLSLSPSLPHLLSTLPVITILEFAGRTYPFRGDEGVMRASTFVDLALLCESPVSSWSEIVTIMFNCTLVSWDWDGNLHEMVSSRHARLQVVKLLWINYYILSTSRKLSGDIVL